MDKKRLIWMLVVGLLSLAADQGTKQLARAKLQNQPPVKVIDNYLALEYHENPGMAFGLGRNWSGGRYILIAIGLVALVLVWRLVRQVERRKRAADIAFGLVAGGAIGNLIDRVYIGRVVDFIVMHWQRKYQWPAYNIADATLVAGVILLVLVLGVRADKAAAEELPAKSRPSGKGKRRKGKA